MGSEECHSAYDADAQQWERAYATWCHLAPLIAGISVLLSDGIAFMVPGLVATTMWLIKRNDSPFIDDHGREAVNFQISLAILFLATVVVGAMTCSVGWIIGFPIWLVLAFVGMLMGTLAAKDGRYFRYPACIRLIPDPMESHDH